MSRLFVSIAMLITALLAACAKHPDISADNVVLAGDPSVNRVIGDDKYKFTVMGAKALRDAVGVSRTAVGGALADDSLVVGFPMGLVGEQQVFGGVITAVSDTKSEDLGMLKLSDLTPLHVRTALTQGRDGKPVLTLLGCVSKCEETSPLVPVVSIPVVAVDNDKSLLVLDLASLGNELNLVEILDPDGSYTKLKTVSSKTVSFDYSLSTLVFDVEVRMVPKDAPATGPVTETVFNARWYLRMGSAFNPAFTARPAAPGVGFFLTERGAAAKVERHARPVTVAGTTATLGAIKYYVKNVPEQFKPAFASAFDAWNDRFVKLTGSNIFAYEFVDAADPRSKLLVPGDIRYHIVEWDLVNKAPYGGLGPSIANQQTGEILSSNVLIQGPTIVGLYTKWFHVSRQIAELRAAGLTNEADILFHDSVLALEKERGDKGFTKPLSLKLGDQLEFRVASQTPALEDPAMQRDDFDPLPDGVSYEQYMFGYFHDMLTHELGHNLGLRHNFRGNLGSRPGITQGGVSDSVMEYLGRDYRFVDDVGSYDVMALGYGYAGTAPVKLDRFCTDEEKASDKKPTASAECSSDDATPDPFSWFEMRLARGIDLLIARGTPDVPVWSVADMEKELKIAVLGMALYASSADATGASWTNFFTGGDRPASSAGVKSYVLLRLKAQLCDASLAFVQAGKPSEEARRKVAENLTALQRKTSEILAPLKVYTEAELACGE